jgi:hypothetical protein
MSNSKTLKELTKNSLDKILNHSSIQNKQIKYHFGLKLYQYASGKHYDHTLDWKNDEEKKIVTDIYRGKTIRGSRPEKQVQRLLLGYQALPIQLTPLRCNISSRAANNSKKQYVKVYMILWVNAVSKVQATHKMWSSLERALMNHNSDIIPNQAHVI